MYRCISLSLALITTLAACSTAPNFADDFSISTTVTPAQFRAGETTTVHVVVKNISLETRSIAANNCPDAFVVVAADGSIVGPGEQICSLEALVAHLEPGAEIGWTQRWTGDARSTGNQPQFLAPGTYTVRGWLIDGGSRNPGASVSITK